MVSVVCMSSVCGIRKKVSVLYWVGPQSFFCERVLLCGQETLGVTWVVVCVSL